MSTCATPDDLAGWDPARRARLSRRVSLHARHPADDVPRPAVDDAAVRRLRPARRNRTRDTGICSRNGVSGLSVAFDLPTQMGYDSDHPLAAGEVGRVGVAIDSIEDMATLFDGIPLDRVSTSMTINATAIILLVALRRASRERQGAVASRARRHGSERHPQGIRRARHLHLSAAAVAADRHRHLRVLRARAAQLEHDFDQRLSHPRGRARRRCRKWRSRLRTRSPTCRRPSTRASTSNQFGQRLSFFFNAHNDFLEEIAKFRAARRLWARIMRDRFHATQPARAAAALSHADRRQHADRAAARQQHRARRAAGAGGGARRHAVAALQRPRRGAGAADRGIGAASRCGRSRSSPRKPASPTPSTRWPARTRSRR